MSNEIVNHFSSLNEEFQGKLWETLNEDERAVLNLILDANKNNKFMKYENDPIGFVERGLGETLWSKQKEILQSLMDNKRTVVPACHAPGKSHLAARAIAWWISVHPPGTAIAVSTASTLRQVRNNM